MKPIGTQEIRTSRLLLRRPQRDDAAALVEIRSLAMPLGEAERCVAGMVEEAGKPFGFHWIITMDNRVVGRVKGWEVDPYNGYVQLGYDVGPAYRGQGIMTEAVGAVIRYLLLQAMAHRVYCSVRDSNTPSRRVCEKCGMTLEGTMRQHYARQDGGYDDVCIYGIIRQDIGEAGEDEHGA